MEHQMLINAALVVLGVFAKYFFDKWNSASDRRKNGVNVDDSYITVRECRHNRTNCANVNSLQYQQLSMLVDEMRSELQEIKSILLQAASNSGLSAEKLTGLTK